MAQEHSHSPNWQTPEEPQVGRESTDRARDGESVAGARAHALAVDLAAARATLQAEKRRSKELEGALAERSSTLAVVRSTVEELLRESEQHKSELRTLRESLAARDARLSALEQETSGETAAAASGARIKRGKSEVNAARAAMNAANSKANSYLELLRTREWRRGFDQNRFQELDAQAGAGGGGHDALESERDRLQVQLAAADSERARWTAELATRDRALAQAQERATSDAQSIAELKQAADLGRAEQAMQIAQLRAEQAAQIERLQAEADRRQEEIDVLMTHLQEARRPIQAFEADLKRLSDELAAKEAAAAQFEEENCRLRATLERASGSLEEREFSADAGAAASGAGDRSAELIRIDGDETTTYVLAKRTRIGRAADCELQIPSSSVSRHHALVTVGPRDTVIEDLNSTNGVLVNGRIMTRHVLADGDELTIGETRFRYFARVP